MFRLLLLVLALALGLMILRQLPDIQRYLRMVTM
jgi:hypothetical protein